jgi:hypothetical protein
MYEKIYKNFLKRSRKFKNIKVLCSIEKTLQNSIFVTLDVYNQKVYTFHKKPVDFKKYSRVCLPIIVTNTQKSHAKLLVIEPFSQKIYIFDPYGYDNYFENTVEDFFEILSYKFNLDGFTLISEKDSNDLCSFQYFEEEEKNIDDDISLNFEKCVLWVFWFIEMMENMNTQEYKSLLNYLSNKEHTSYKKIIYEYFEELSK